MRVQFTHQIRSANKFACTLIALLLTGQGDPVGYGDPTVEVTVGDASSIPAGVYIVRLEAGREAVSRKVVLMK